MRTCPCCGLSNKAHRSGCPYYEPESTVTAEEVAAGIPESVSRAYDIMVADKVPVERAAAMAVAMHEQHMAGRIAKTAEQQAEHFVNLRHSLRTMSNEGS